MINGIAVSLKMTTDNSARTTLNKYKNENKITLADTTIFTHPLTTRINVP